MSLHDRIIAAVAADDRWEISCLAKEAAGNPVAQRALRAADNLIVASKTGDTHAETVSREALIPVLMQLK